MNSASERKFERELLKNGTVVGPVTQEMIDRCKAKGPKDYEYWPDFLSQVREEMTEGQK